jgi:hypothetical protein
MNKYIIPVCNIPDSEVYDLIINANSYSECQDKIMNKFLDYSEKDNYNDFIKDLDSQDILIGRIADIEEL